MSHSREQDLSADDEIAQQRSCDMWAGMVAYARRLDAAELRRHAAVSRDNRHACVECFCCACAVALEEHYKACHAGRRSII